MGGPYPFQSPPRRLYSRAHGLPISMASLWVPWEPWAIGPKAQWPPSVWGNTLARRLGSYLPTIPWCILPDGPPNTRGPLEVLVGLFTDFSDFLGRLLVVVEFYSRDYLFTRVHVFFQMMSSRGITSSNE